MKQHDCGEDCEGCECQDSKEELTPEQNAKVEKIVAQLLSEVEDEMAHKQREEELAQLQETWRLTGGPQASASQPSSQPVTSRIDKPDGTKLGRNDKCPCNSGKKFKRCCWELVN